MRVKSLELEIEWPQNVKLFNLRSFIEDKIHKYGDPLRWAITEVKDSENPASFRKLLVEAVVIIL